MSFTFLPRTIFKNGFFIRHAKNDFPSHPAIEEKIYTRDGFFYIGKDAGSIDKLVNVFRRGYASRMPGDAKFELHYSLAENKNVIPEIIFCESNFDPASIREFSDFLKTHPALSSVPFVINDNDLSEEELSNLKRTMNYE